MKKTYQALKEELDEVLAKLQDPVTDIDDAIKLHEHGKKLLEELRTYVEEAEAKIKKATE
jgi:exodeoxyribonuclease VII small subunit